MKNLALLLFLTALLFQNCGVKNYKSNSNPVSHDQWDQLLHKHVATDGGVNYQGFLQDSVALNSYLALLSTAHPNAKNWTRDEQIAYWINAYNAFTVKLIVDEYPVNSIKDIKNGIPFVNTVWDIKFIKIEKAEYDLNNIEHGILRPKYDEPRVHFALNCASYSCPRLRNEAYVAERLEEQLSDQARLFLADQRKNVITDPSRVQLSKIFNWFSGDFTKGKQTLVGFINQYSPVQLTDDTEIEYMDYDWRLNSQEHYAETASVTFVE